MRGRVSDASARRRSALVRILGRRADPILSTVVSDTLRSEDFAGLGQRVAARYLTKAREGLPACVDALGAADAERGRILREQAETVKLLVAEGVPPSVQRHLVALGFRVASGIARDGARIEGFAPDELEDELHAFRREFESTFFGA